MIKRVNQLHRENSIITGHLSSETASILHPKPDPKPDLALIRAEMRMVDDHIAKRLATTVPLIGQVSWYIIAAGGKRLRPALLLLISGALGYRGRQHLNLAAVVEFIHTATLLHDDVVDESTLRRGRPTANQVFGNASSVLVGDFLYSRAFQMMVETGNMRVMEVLAEATNVISEGEVQQLINMHDVDLDEAGYLEVVRSKTAKLFEASARLGAIVAGAPKAVEEACAIYGQALGTAFQIIDDLLDYDGDPDQMGKNLGDDLREGKVTLPCIVAMQRAEPVDRALIRDAIQSGSGSSLAQVVAIVRATGAIEATRSAAAAEASRAANSLSTLEDGPYKTCLLQLAMHLTDRQS